MIDNNTGIGLELYERETERAQASVHLGNSREMKAEALGTPRRVDADPLPID